MNSILALLRHSNRPLLVSWPFGWVEAGPPTIRHILVPLDGSERAEGALDSAVDVARAAGARITLAHVVAVTTMLGPRSTTPTGGKLRADHASAEAYLERVAAPLREAGLDVQIRVAEGETPAPTLSELADAVGADMIMMAANDYGGLRRTLLGSVSEELLRVSPLPVLITPPQGPRLRGSRRPGAERGSGRGDGANSSSLQRRRGIPDSATGDGLRA